MVKAGIQVTGLTEVLRELNRLGPAVNREVRVSAKAIAEDEAPRLRAAAERSGDRLSAAVGVTVRARSDRVPKIVGGGAKRVSTSRRPKAGDVFFGAEFGGGKRDTTKQFRPYKRHGRGGLGYWLWPQIRQDQERMMTEWLAALDRVLNNKTDGGTS